MALSWLLNTYISMKLICYEILIYSSHFKNDDRMFFTHLVFYFNCWHQCMRKLITRFSDYILIIILCLYSHFVLRKIILLNYKLNQNLLYRCLHLVICLFFIYNIGIIGKYYNFLRFYSIFFSGYMLQFFLSFSQTKQKQNVHQEFVWNLIFDLYGSKI